MGELITWVRAQWDRTAGLTLLGSGAVLLLSGWVGVSGTSERAGQLSYLVSGGLGGLFCLAAGASFLLLADLDDEWRKLNELSGVLLVREHHATRLERRRRGMLLGIAVAALVLTTGWFWTSGADDQQGATPGLLMALLALVSAWLVEGAALVRTRQSLSRRKAGLIDEVSCRWPVIDLRAEPSPEPAPAPVPGTVLTAEGLRLFHRPGCPTMAGVDAVAVARDRVKPDLLPCQLCEAQ